MFDKLFGHTEPLERGLDLATFRHRLIASNIANVDTPSYKPGHVDFESALAAADQSLELRQTDDRHLGSAASQVRMTFDLTPRRPDGNAVNPEQEMADLASNTALYNIFVNALNKKFSGLKAAIMEGRG